MIRIKKYSWLMPGIIVLILAAAFLLPVRIPWSVKAPGKILCSREWSVTVNTDGGIVASLGDKLAGVTRQVGVTQFERGDAFRFTLLSAFAAGARVRAGDTVGVIRSSMLDWELERLQGELEVARATIDVTVTGEKKAIVEEARNTVEHARRQAEYYRALQVRQKQLFDKELIAKQEYELAEQQAATSALQIAIAEERLRSVSTGAKQEEVDLARVRVRSLSSEIAALDKRRQWGILVSPIAGVMTGSPAPDTLAVVSDTTSYVLLIPVPLQDRSYIREGQPVRLSIPETGESAAASVVAVDGKIQTVNGMQVVMATARIDRAPTANPNGLLARCTIECAPVTLREHLRRSFHAILR